MSVNIIDYLISHAHDTPEKTAFIFLQKEENRETEKRISYHELLQSIHQRALQLSGLQPGSRALLIYQHAAGFIISFLACQYAGIIAVPVPYGKGVKQLSRIKGILEDAMADTILCDQLVTEEIRRALAALDVHQSVKLISTSDDELPVTTDATIDQQHNNIAFLQYTSGSTGMPKGVIISHENLLHNQQLITNAFGCDKRSVILSWLPFHHDMGLIGNILHTIYTGCTCVLMSPLQFMQSPHTWLEAISRYKVTHSGGPNFAYDLCLEKVSKTALSALDLSCWKVAYNGSEPVRAATIQRFAAHFRAAGFRKNVFAPCYGLAEATLLVASHKKKRPPLTVFIHKAITQEGKIMLAAATEKDVQPVVSAGSIAAGMELKIIRSADGHVCDELEEGEICISGESVSTGYWNKDNAPYYYEMNGRLFFRTGDLGFMYKQELFVHGRIKEMLIIRGKNYYPYDLEQAAAASHPAIESNGVAVFGHPAAEDAVILVAEIRRTFIHALHTEELFGAINSAVTGLSGLSLYDILLVTPRSIPRTSSGKLQRVKCRDLYIQQGFHAIHAMSDAAVLVPAKEQQEAFVRDVIEKRDYDSIKTYLTSLIRAKITHLPPRLEDHIPLTELGVDSLRSMELINTINRDLNINTDAVQLSGNNTLSGFITAIENMLWLKNAQISEKEIII